MNGKLDVLFVDDEESILKSLERLCRKEPWIVKTASSGEAALAICADNQVALVVSDMRMPGMDGAELLSRIAQEYPQVRQILLTGYSDLNATVKAINNAKISHYVAKPWDNAHLKQLIADSLAEARLREEHATLVALTEQQNEELKELNESLEQQVALRTQALKKAVQNLHAANAVLKSSYASFVRVFSQFIELRDARMSPTSSEISAQVRLVAERMNIEPETIDQLSFAAMLRNLGKLTLPDNVLNTPYENMPADKKIAYRKYPELGQSLLLSIENLEIAANIIGTHQERINGKGFPNNLADDEISVPAQILGVVNEYHDLSNGVLTAARLSHEKICQYLEAQKGKRYDAQIVNHFFDVLVQSKTSGAEPNSAAIDAIQLREGMVLAKDLVTPQGLFLIAKDAILSPRIIDKIIRFEKDSDEKFHIRVYPPSSLDAT